MTFKYCGVQIPDLLYNMTDSLVGYSSVDDKAIYKINVKIDRKIIDDIIYHVNEDMKHLDKISLFLRKYKTNKLFGTIIDKDMELFVTFVQYYYDNINDIIIY